MEASGSTRRVHGYFENPINLVFFPSLSPSLSLSLSSPIHIERPSDEISSSSQSLVIPRAFWVYHPISSGFPLFNLSPSSPLHTLPSKSKPRFSSPPYPTISIFHLPIHLSLAFSTCPRSFLGFDAPPAETRSFFFSSFSADTRRRAGYREIKRGLPNWPEAEDLGFER